MKELKLYFCKNCKKIIEIITDGIDPEIKCCGKNMKKIEANTSDASIERHIPAVNVEDSSMFVEIGEVIHPMEDKHYISCIYVVDNLGNFQKFKLSYNDNPEISLDIDERAKKVDVYSFCNVHGLWKKQIKL